MVTQFLRRLKGDCAVKVKHISFKEENERMAGN
jgi:hypothetical protein